MKSKITSPDMIKEHVGIKASSYKTLLEKDLENLKKETELQNFFIITEHKFACGSVEPLLVIGLTPDWKDFLKQQIIGSNANFGTGECKLTPDGKGIALGLERGKVKPSAVEKSFKKSPVLKNIKPAFSILDATMNDTLSAAEEDEITNAIFTTIKKQLDEYKAAKPNDKLNKLKALKLSIDEWQTKFDSQNNKSDDEYKIAGSLAKLEQQLDAEVAVLNKVDAPQNASPKNGNAVLFDEIRQEFAEVKSSDIKSELHTESDLKKILVDINDVINLVLIWEKNNPFNPKENADTAAQRKQIDMLHFNMRKYIEFVQKRLDDKDYAESGYAKTSANDIKKLAGFPADDKEFDTLLANYETVWEFLRTEMKTFEQLTDKTNKQPADAEKDQRLAHAHYIKVKKVQEAAVAWLQKSQKATYILPASKKAALQKQTAVQHMIVDLSSTISMMGVKLNLAEQFNEDSAFIMKNIFEHDYKVAQKSPSDRDAFFDRIDKFKMSYLVVHFDVITTNPIFLKAFRAHLVNEVNIDPLDFYLMAKDPKIYKDPAQAQNIYDDYISTNGSKSINISGKDLANFSSCVQKYNNDWQKIVADPIWETSIKSAFLSISNDLTLEPFPRFVNKLGEKQKDGSISNLQKLFLGV